MNKKTLFLLTPALIVASSLVGCNSGGSPTPTPTKTLTKIIVRPTMNTYFVGFEFTSFSIGTFQAVYSDGSTTPIKSGYTSDPVLPYTFVEDDIGTKTFTFYYGGKSASFDVTVKSK